MRYRILYIEESTSVGGAIISLYELVRGLDKNRYEPVVAFYAAHPVQERFHRLGVKVATLWNETYPQRPPANLRGDESIKMAAELRKLALFELPAAWRIAGLIKQEAIDLVHHNSHLHKDRTNVLACALMGVPQVCHIRNPRRFSSLERFLSRNVSAFIYTSRAVEQSYRQMGISPARGIVIHNPIDASSFLQCNDPTRVRTEFGLSKQDQVISNIGRIDTWKGHDIFLMAMAEIVRAYPKAKALIVGAFPETALRIGHDQKLKQMIVDLGLTEHVVFTGFRQDVPDIMAASDVIVHSASLPEPFGRTVAEGMAAGKPVVATAAGGVLDIVEHEVNGLLVPREDSSAMASAISWILDNPEKATQMARSGQQRIIERFNVQLHVDAVQNLYKSLLDGKRQMKIIQDH